MDKYLSCLNQVVEQTAIGSYIIIFDTKLRLHQLEKLCVMISNQPLITGIMLSVMPNCINIGTVIILGEYSVHFTFLPADAQMYIKYLHYGPYLFRVKCDTHSFSMSPNSFPIHLCYPTCSWHAWSLFYIHSMTSV